MTVVSRRRGRLIDQSEIAWGDAWAAGIIHRYVLVTVTYITSRRDGACIVLCLGLSLAKSE
jgi:hypothetical protein